MMRGHPAIAGQMRARVFSPIAPFGAQHQQRRGAVVRRRNFSGHRTAGARLNFANFQAGIAARALIGGYQDRVASALWDGHRGDLLCELAAVYSGNSAAVTFQAEGILHLAGDLGHHLGDVLGSLAHGFCAIQGFQARVRVAPAQGSIVGSQVAKRKGFIRFGERIRRPGHALHTAGDEHLPFSGFDSPGGDVDRCQA
jgi:hypothetical protein